MVPEKRFHLEFAGMCLRAQTDVARLRVHGDPHGTTPRPERNPRALSRRFRVAPVPTPPPNNSLPAGKTFLFQHLPHLGGRDKGSRLHHVGTLSLVLVAGELGGVRLITPRTRSASLLLSHGTRTLPILLCARDLVPALFTTRTLERTLDHDDTEPAEAEVTL